MKYGSAATGSIVFSTFTVERRTPNLPLRVFALTVMTGTGFEVVSGMYCWKPVVLFRERLTVPDLVEAARFMRKWTSKVGEKNRLRDDPTLPDVFPHLISSR